VLAMLPRSVRPADASTSAPVVDTEPPDGRELTAPQPGALSLPVLVLPGPAVDDEAVDLADADPSPALNGAHSGGEYFENDLV
jgi:hypothetical protein